MLGFKGLPFWRREESELLKSEESSGLGGAGGAEGLKEGGGRGTDFASTSLGGSGSLDWEGFEG